MICMVGAINFHFKSALVKCHSELETMNCIRAENGEKNLPFLSSLMSKIYLHISRCFPLFREGSKQTCKICLLLPRLHILWPSEIILLWNLDTFRFGKLIEFTIYKSEEHFSLVFRHMCSQGCLLYCILLSKFNSLSDLIACIPAILWESER